jgi:hypothetical protein
MNRTFLVLALALLGCAGCRTMGSNCGQACGKSCAQPCDNCCEPCHVATMKNAPRPGDGSSCVHGTMEGSCPGGQGCVFDRYRGSECGPQYPEGPYDCQACGACDWGCNGHRHPMGYKTGHECYCQNGCQNGACGGQPNCVCQHCGRGYCCGSGPAPGCSCCPFCGCGPSGDQNYNFNPGPPVAQTAYPYYTLRGPRDFLLNNPPSIGPY